MTLGFTPRPTAPVRLASEGRLGDRYLFVLGLCLLGYALMGRAFAYLGVPPLFIGEALLAAGLALTIRLRGLHRLGSVGPFWVLLALQVLTVVRSVPYVGLYGLDVVRDAMLFGYGFYAYVAYLLVVERPERLRDLVVRYRTFALVMVALVWLPYLAYRINETWIPFVPGQDNVRIIEAKGGDLLVHLSAIAAFLVLGLRRPSWAVTLGLATTSVLVMVSNRGGMIAFVLAVALALVLRPPSTRGARLGIALVAVLVAGIIAIPVMEQVRISGNSRELTVEQIWDNVKSVVGQSDSNTLETTKTWRLTWWKKIIDDTVFGDKLWTGRGFGLNFADYDGFAVDDEGSLRSPHNATMTVLGRMGVPGLALWLLLHAWWVWTLAWAWWRARLARRDTWAAVFAFGLCLWIALVVNASFEVYFEGPMGGIWFWTTIGLGLAAVRVFKTHPDLFSTLAFGKALPRTLPPPMPDADVLPKLREAIAATPWTTPEGTPTSAGPTRAPAAVPIVPPRAEVSWGDAPTPWDRPQRRPAAPPRTAAPTAPRPTVAPPPVAARPPVQTPPVAPPAVPLRPVATSPTRPPADVPAPVPVRAPAAPPGLAPTSAAWASAPSQARPLAPRRAPARPTDARWEAPPTSAAWRSS